MLRKFKIYQKSLQNAQHLAEWWRGPGVPALTSTASKVLRKAKEWRDFIHVGMIQKGFLKLEFGVDLERRVG